MRKRNLGIAIICLAVLLAGCGQAPASTLQESTAPDVRMEAQITDAVQTEPSSEALQMETETTEPETTQLTEPIREQTSTEQETDRPTTQNTPQTQPDEPTPTQAAPKETTQPTQPSAPPTTTEPKPTEPKPTEPKPTEPKPTEPPAPAPTEPTTEAPTEPPTEAPTEPPTEPPTESQAPAIDIAALEAYGNQYAAQLGFQVDYTMTASNAGYFPPNSAILSSMSDGYRLVSEQVSVTRDYLMAYVGSIDGARCRVLVSNDGNGQYTCTVLYG